MSSEYLKPTGGVGQFAKSICQLMKEYGIKVDIITDKEPNDKEFTHSLEGVNVIFPDKPVSYGTHKSIFMYGDSFCYERMANFRNSIIKALTYNLYDVFICNTYETIQVALTMGIEDNIQIIGYTHLESQIFKDSKNPFLNNVNEMMRKQLEMPGLYVGTQSKFNSLQIENSFHLPIPLPEPSLLKEYNNPREGVLFIGRWEEGKNPELYCDLIEQTKLPARIITSDTSEKKFKDRFKKLGITDYIIKTNIVGQEKVDFITSCRVAFNPSTVESYGIAFLEQQIQMPTFALEDMRWTNNFDKKHFITVNKKDMVELVKKFYDEFVDGPSWYQNGILKQHIVREGQIFHKWNECFNSFKPKQSNSSKAQILTHKTIRYSDYIKKLDRDVLCIDDITSVLNNKHKYNVIYTDNDTWLTQDPDFVIPEDSHQGKDLFNFV